MEETGQYDNGHYTTVAGRPAKSRLFFYFFYFCFFVFEASSDVAGTSWRRNEKKNKKRDACDCDCNRRLDIQGRMVDSWWL